ncbi:MAG TPA: flippase activity-associated protein Agl23 [Candidatus Limnocylindrales bacterium]|nr:flippase activity-associated protein Agl23 [Candidatus Limnocylindrales bacterium]
MNRWSSVALLVALVVAIGLRWPRLDERPMHNDEAVNAIKFGELWQHGHYKYDPNEHHGPSLIYATAIVSRLTAAPDLQDFSDQRLRWVTVLFGLGLIGLLPLVIDGLGRFATVWAAAFTATSPALVFYSRYYIHELLLVFFTFLALAAGWRYWRSRQLGWILLAGAALALMDATKETFVITLAAAAAAVVINQAWNRYVDASGFPVSAPRLNLWHLGAGFGVWVVVAALLFSSFFSNSAGPLDSLRTYGAWFGRAAGDSPHIHSWTFYLHRLLWFHPAKGPVFSEALILILALIAAIAGFRRQRLSGANASLIRFLALYAFILCVIYSLLPYKTPWCLLTFWHAMILLAGVGVAVVVRPLRWARSRMVLNWLFLAGAGLLAVESWAASVTYASDQRNPYVYAQTSKDILKLVSKVDALATVSSDSTSMLIKVMAPDQDYWPLPWYLRRFERVGWWDRVPEDPFAPVMIVSAGLHARLDEKGTHLMVGYFQLRPEVFFELYVEKALWSTWLAKRPPQPDNS